MSDKTVTIGIKTTADVAGAKATTTALDKVESSAKKAAKATDEGGKGMGKAGMLANQASFQVGDFFTQVEMGTSKMRAFSQQAPQLIGAFQMAGVFTGPVSLALAGIAVALPLIAMGVDKLSGGLGAATEEAEKSAEAITKFGTRTTTELEKEITAREAAIDKEVASIGKLDQQWGKTTKASKEYSDSVLENARQYAVVQTQITALLGIKRDRMIEIRELEREEEERIKKKADDELKALQDTQKAAEKKAAAMMAVLAKAAAEAEKYEAKLEQARANKKGLAGRRKGLENDVANDVGFLDSLGRGEYGDLSGLPKDNSGPQRRQAANSARAQLAEGGPMAALEKQNAESIKMLSEKVAGLNSKVAAINEGTLKAAEEVTDGEKSLAIDAARIKDALQTGELQAKTKRAVDESMQVAADIGDVLAQLEPTTAKAKANTGSLKSLIGDLHVTADEIPEATRQIKELVGGLQLIPGMQSIIQELLKIQENMKVLKYDMDKVIANNRSIGETLRRQQ